jgi:glycosyltransferase involved in cell wall biosynthesis
LLPTHSDGFAITQLEALAYDLPIIASRNCGDVIEDEMQGLRLEAVTAEAIEGAIRRALAHPDLLASMAMRASARLAQFSPDRVVDFLVEEMEASFS